MQVLLSITTLFFLKGHLKGFPNQKGRISNKNSCTIKIFWFLAHLIGSCADTIVFDGCVSHA